LDENQFIHLPSLKYIFLQNNAINQIADTAFNGQTTSLEALTIHDNRISSLGNMFSLEFTSLQRVYLQNNEIAMLMKESVQGLTQVEEMSLSGNTLLNIITPNAFCGMSNLKRLDISQNSMPTYYPDMFICIQQLEELYINNPTYLLCDGELKSFKAWADLNENILPYQNLMQCNQPSHMNGLTLSSLSVSNMVSEGSCPSQCACFSGIVDCANRGLDTVPEDISLDSQEIFLQGNALSRIVENQFSHLPNLQYIYLQDNKISELAASSFQGPAKKLKSLIMHNNQISVIPDYIFDGMSSLTVLNFNENMIETIPYDFLKDCPELVEVSFYRNSLVSIDGAMFNKLPKLKYLGLAYNKLTTVPDSLGSESQFLIDLAHNELTEMPVISSNTKQLFFNGNQIQALRKEIFENAASLQELYISNNTISTIEDTTFEGAPKLNWLDVSENDLTGFESNTLDQMPSLYGLTVTNNKQLVSIADDAFTSFAPTLERLILDGCGLTTLNPEVITTLTNPGLYVWLGDNPWNCDCDLQGLSEYIASGRNPVYDNAENNQAVVTCVTPPELEGTQLSEVDYTVACYQPEPITPETEDADPYLALIISLSIVGAVLLFALLSCVVYRSRIKPESDPMNDLTDVDVAFDTKKGSRNVNVNKNGGTRNKAYVSEL